MGIEWLENDQLFRDQLSTGEAWQRYTAHFLALQGLPCAVPEPGFRETAADHGEYADTVDVWCLGFRFEVKSRPLIFSSPKDFPYDWPIVMSCGSWEGMRQKPDAILNVSQATGAMMWLSMRSKSDWVVKLQRDGVRGITEPVFTAHRSQWQPIHRLVLHVQQIRDKVAQCPTCSQNGLTAYNRPGKCCT